MKATSEYHSLLAGRELKSSGTEYSSLYFVVWEWYKDHVLAAFCFAVCTENNEQTCLNFSTSRLWMLRISPVLAI